MNEVNDKRLAVLIDADNISPKNIKSMLIEISRYGTPTIKRIYGDWTKPELVGWKNSLLEHAITPIQQYGYTTGKNSTDSAMIIDAMDILYTGDIDGFCIVSSDSDFTRLAIRLREAGKTVYGIGERKTPVSFISACSKFIYVEIIRKEQGLDNVKDSLELSASESTIQGKKGPAEQDKISGPNQKSAVKGVCKELIASISSSVSDLSDEDGWANLAAVGAHIIRKQPDFDPRNYGFDRLTPLLRSLGEFELDERITSNSKVKHIYIRNKEKQDNQKELKSSPVNKKRKSKPKTLTKPE
jgi:uncharacterized LabA/DUF88 family protein